MKIEQGNIHITDIPVFERIKVTPDSIILSGFFAVDDWEETRTREEVTALRDALTAALDAHDRMTGAPAASSTPRVFNAGDPEPPVGTKVRDTDGDVWERGPRGWGIGYEAGADTWSMVLRYAPLTEVR